MMPTVEAIVKCVRDRGLYFVVVDGRPNVRGPGASVLVTDPVKKVLAEFRAQLIDYLKLEVTKPAPASEPDFTRNVRTMDGFGQSWTVMNHANGEWKSGMVAWQYIGETGWRPIPGREDKFPSGIAHA